MVHEVLPGLVDEANAILAGSPLRLADVGYALDVVEQPSLWPLFGVVLTEDSAELRRVSPQGWGDDAKRVVPLTQIVRVAALRLVSVIDWST